ncbi:MAG: hypothetical protein QF810_04220, partial [Candidatus Poseidoniia archaeon]|nr:hypothetical protein [Candidatus Poseidoniia archaeon]
MTQMDRSGLLSVTLSSQLPLLLLAVTPAGRRGINLHQTISQSKKIVYLSDKSWKGRATYGTSLNP